MNTLCLWIVTILYAAQGSIWFAAGRKADALIVTGYVIANVGLIARAS